MGINAAVDGTRVGGYLVHYPLRHSEQKRPELRAHRTSWIYMVKVGRVRTNQFNFKTKPLTLAPYCRELGPQLKKKILRNWDL